MANNVIVVYDDSRRPNKNIRSITGGKSYGETIFKRITLKERMNSYFKSMEAVSSFIEKKDLPKLGGNKNEPVILLYSNYVVADEKAVEMLITKALYVHENYRVLSDNKNACVIFRNVEEFMQRRESEYDDFTVIDSDAFCDISDVMNFRKFITSGFEARFFNSLSGDEYTVIKTSDNVQKLKAEYSLYALLPDRMKQWFVMPYDFTEDGGNASYSMKRYHMTDLAIRYVHGAITVEEFEKILDNIFFFLNIRDKKEVSSEEYEKRAYELYVKKVQDRIQQLKETSGYAKIAELIASSTDYKSIDDIVEKYISLYEKYQKSCCANNIKVVSHGDLCFSNILYSDEVSLIKFIDPKGALKEEDMYMDPYYDIAKLSHSICGHYDFFNSDRFEISMDEKMNSRLYVDSDNRTYVEIFKHKLSRFGVKFELIRVYETSLFLSMLPLHMDRPKKVFAFILNAIAIMESLEV